MGVLLWVVGIVVVAGAVFWLSHRMLVSGGGGGASFGDGLGGISEVFDPGGARARDELRENDHRQVVTPSPDPDDDRAVRFVNGPGGVPKSVRITRPPAEPPTC